jgi:hypothetical protein
MPSRNLLSAVGAALLLSLSLTVTAFAGGRPLSATMTGAQEVPGPGDPDGSGIAMIWLNQGQGTVCWFISVEDITLPATAAHIHPGAAGVANSPIVNLGAPGADGTSTGCTEDVPRDLIKDIRQNPESYYVNVHTLPDFGPGAVRGQLAK